MGGGLPADCGRRNMEFPTPFRATLNMKNTIGYKTYGIRNCKNQDNKAAWFVAVSGKRWYNKLNKPL